MSSIGQYLLSIIASAVIVSLSNTFIERKSIIGSILKLVTGLILATVIVTPWTDLRLTDLEKQFSHAEFDASILVSEGQQLAHSEICKHIKSKTTAYILDKADALGLAISADVILTEESIPSIHKILISGPASPYAKQRLTQILLEDFGVTEECLEWS